MARNNAFLLKDTIGTPGTGVTAQEFGDRSQRQTVLTINYTLPAIAGGANLAVGRKIYTLPAGAARVTSTSMSVSIKQTEAHITADTPDVGIGTTIGSGAVAVLGGTAAFENILTGQTAADCDGTNTVKSVDTSLVIESADSHDIYLNVADGWAASGDAAALLRGTVVINWQPLSVPA